LRGERRHRAATLLDLRKIHAAVTSWKQTSTTAAVAKRPILAE